MNITGKELNSFVEKNREMLEKRLSELNSSKYADPLEPFTLEQLFVGVLDTWLQQAPHKCSEHLDS